MLQDKVMVNDALSMSKSSLTFYATAISECANPTLRATLQQFRNSDEARHYELFKIAQQKGYYQPAAMAEMQDVQQVKTQAQG